ncbi:hypothetical protein ACQY74_000173 (plasmid) [Rhizobium leguminosarum bv. trifolii]
MLHVPALGLPLQELGAAIRYGTRLSDRVREIAILCVAAETDSAFERYAHERVGRAVGLGETELNDLAASRFSAPSSSPASCRCLMRKSLTKGIGRCFDWKGQVFHRTDGYYWITGRVDDVLNVSGHRVGTAEV